MFMNFVTLPLHHFGDSSVNLPSKNSGDFWTSLMGFRFVLNTSATHHNPIICTSKKQNARQRPAKTTPIEPKDFWREISSEKKKKTNFPKSARNLMTNFARSFRKTNFQFHLRLDRKKPSKLRHHKIPIRTIQAQLKYN
jgi:hypothetical protein